MRCALPLLCAVFAVKAEDAPEGYDASDCEVCRQNAGGSSRAAETLAACTVQTSAEGQPCVLAGCEHTPADQTHLDSDKAKGACTNNGATLTGTADCGAGSSRRGETLKIHEGDAYPRKASKGWPHHLGGWWNGHYAKRTHLVKNNIYGVTMGKLQNHKVYSVESCHETAQMHQGMGERVIAFSFTAGHNRCDVWTGSENLMSHGVLGSKPYGWSDWCCSYWSTYLLADIKLPAPSEGVSGDPFVTDKTGAKKQFFLPLQTDVLLLACQGMSIQGRAFGSGVEGDHQQWFDKFHVTINGEDQVVVSVRKNATAADETNAVADAVGSKKLNILNVKVEQDTMLKTGAMGLDTGALVAVWSSPTGETVQFSHGTTVFQIKSAVAQKFTEKEMQLSYTHLDLRFVELQSSACSGGVLAEIWGVAPMSQATSAMLLPPQ